MKAAYVALGILAMAAAGAAYAYRRAAGFDDAAAPEQAGAGDDWTGTVATWLAGDDQEVQQRAQTMKTIINADQNVRALLEAIARAEGTAQQPDPYRVCYAYRERIDGLDGQLGTFDDWHDHPSITGEWKGEKLPDNQCRAAGFSPGCVSTAAGKYQITRTTWRKLKPRLGLRDFSPASQDAAAVELLRESGALDLIQAGRFDQAVNAARRIWASLPGSGYEQPERSLAWLRTQYTDAGGTFA